MAKVRLNEGGGIISFDLSAVNNISVKVALMPIKNKI
jgi:hypothetical protein